MRARRRSHSARASGVSASTRTRPGCGASGAFVCAWAATAVGDAHGQHESSRHSRHCDMRCMSVQDCRGGAGSASAVVLTSSAGALFVLDTHRHLEQPRLSRPLPRVAAEGLGDHRRGQRVHRRQRRLHRRDVPWRAADPAGSQHRLWRRGQPRRGRGHRHLPAAAQPGCGSDAEIHRAAGGVSRRAHHVRRRRRTPALDDRRLAARVQRAPAADLRHRHRRPAAVQVRVAVQSADPEGRGRRDHRRLVAGRGATGRRVPDGAAPHVRTGGRHGRALLPRLVRGRRPVPPHPRSRLDDLLRAARQLPAPRRHVGRHCWACRG